MKGHQTSNQLCFDFYDPRPEAPDFFVSKCNDGAYEWIQNWPYWPHHSLQIYGPPKSGKTHLGRIWQEKSNALYLTPRNIRDYLWEDLVSQNQSLVFDESFGLLQDNSILHIYNSLKECQKFILILSQQPVAQNNFQLKDLSSRIKSIPSLALSSPDDKLIRALYIKFFADNQIIMSDRNFQYLITRTPRNYQSIFTINSEILEVSRYSKISFQTLNRILTGMHHH